MQLVFSFAKKALLFNGLAYTSGILLSFLANLCQMLAFFLPIKAVLLSVSGEDLIWAGDAQYMYLVLAAFSLVAYGAHFIFGKCQDIISIRQATALFVDAGKISQVDNFEEEASKLYGAACNIFSFSLLIASLLVLGSVYVYDYVEAYLILSLIISGVYWLGVMPFLSNDKKSNLAGLVQFVSNVIFFAYFLVVLFYLRESGSVLFGVIALICTRVIGQMLCRLARDLVFIKNNHFFIKAHFFSSTTEHTAAKDNQDKKDKALETVCCLLADESEQPVKLIHYQTGRKGVGVLSASFADLEPAFSLRYSYILSITYAREQELFSQPWSTNLPRLELYNRYQDDAVICNVYKGEIHRYPRLEEPNLIKDFSLRMWSVSIPKDFIERYIRSYGSFSFEFDEEFILSLKNISYNAEQLAVIEWLQVHYQEINDYCKRLPVIVINPDVYWANLFKSDSGSVVALSWDKWGLGYAGAGIPIAILELVSEQDLQFLTNSRRDFSGVDKKSLMVASLIHRVSEHNKYDSFEFVLDELSKLRDIFN